MKIVGVRFLMGVVPVQTRRVTIGGKTWVRRARRAAGVCLFALSLHPAPALANDWMLMPREGECHDLAQALQQQFGDLPPVATPEQLVEALRGRGVAVRATTTAGSAQDVVTVEVPQSKRPLILAKRQRCRQFARPVQ